MTTKKSDLRGVLVPLTTPFDTATGDVSPVALRENTRRLLDDGLNGVLVAGSTGEASLLSETEFAQSIEWLRDVVADDQILMAGGGRESTRATMAACRAAAEAGADTVLVRPPSYFSASLTPASLIDHFRAVADASPIPVLVYNIPKYTHLQVPDAVFAALTEHPNIVGAKDSSGDLKSLAAYREAAPDWAIFVGSGALLYAGLELGAVGGIVAVANFAAPLAVDIYAAYTSGDTARAGGLQETLTPLHREIVGQLGPAGIKAAMEVRGLAGGPARPPIPSADDTVRERVAVLLQSAELAPT